MLRKLLCQQGISPPGLSQPKSVILQRVLPLRARDARGDSLLCHSHSLTPSHRSYLPYLSGVPGLRNILTEPHAGTSLGKPEQSFGREEHKDTEEPVYLFPTPPKPERGGSVGSNTELMNLLLTSSCFSITSRVGQAVCAP